MLNFFEKINLKKLLKYLLFMFLALITAGVQMLRTMAGDSFSFSMITTLVIQALWSMPPAVLAYFPPAKWIK